MASARVRLTAVVPGQGHRYKDQGLGSSPIGSSRYVSAGLCVARVSQGQEGASVRGSGRKGPVCGGREPWGGGAPCTFRPIARAMTAPFSASSESFLAVSAAATRDLRPMALLFTLLCSCANRLFAWLGLGLGLG
jgi:hypothetical protein